MRTRFWMRLIGGILFAHTAHANTVSVGETLPTRSLSDQFNRTCGVNNQTQTLIFSREKAVNTMVSGYLNGQGQAVMQQHVLLYLADISQMPALVTRMLAIPSMRKMNFSICLSRDGKVSMDIPRRTGHATVIRLLNGMVQSVDYARSRDQLSQIIGR